MDLLADRSNACPSGEVKCFLPGAFGCHDSLTGGGGGRGAGGGGGGGGGGRGGGGGKGEGGGEGGGGGGSTSTKSPKLDAGHRAVAWV